MLQVCTKAFGFKGCPDGVLGHAIGLSGPARELVGVNGELFLERGDDAAVFKEENLLGDR